MKKVLKTVVNILAWIVLILALLVTLVVFSSGRNNGVANLFGFIPMTVESDSMKPTFKKDDLIICKEIDDINSLKEGDVITFWTIIDGKKVKNTHRIVEINVTESTRSFITRGDNNSLDDDMPAYAGDLIGQWTEFKISGAGKPMSFLRTKTGFFVCIVIPMAIFFLIELYKFIVTVQEVRKPALTVDDEEEIKRKAIEEYLASQKQAAESQKTETAAAEKPESKPETAETPVAPKQEKPAETAETTEAAKQEETAEKTETTEATEQAEQTETAETTEATEQAESTETAETTEATEQAESTETAETNEATEQAESTETAETNEAAEQAEPTETAETNEAAEQEESSETAETAETEEESSSEE